MKIIKGLSIAVIILIAILGVCVYAATSFIDKSLVESQVSKALGREMMIEGELSPQFSLSPTIKITDATLANAEWASKKPLAKIGEVEVTLEIIPLLSNKVQIDTLTLKNSEISLENQKGKWNFDFSDVEEVDENAEEVVTQKSGQDLSIGSVNIENVTITVKDGKTSTYKINSLKLDSGSQASDIFFEGLIDGKKLKLKASINAVKEILETKKASAQNIDITYDGYSIKANAEANIEEKKASLKNLRVAALGYNISGNIDANLSKKTPYISGSLSVGDIDLSPKKATAADEAEPAAAKSAELYSKDPLPLDALSALNADLEIAVKSLKLNDEVTLTKISIPTKISGSVLTAKNATADLAGSKVSVDLKLSKTSSSFALDTKGLRVGDLLLGSEFTGALTDISTNFTARGNSIHALVNSLSGTSKVHLKDAVYAGAVKDGLLKKLVKLLAGGTSSVKTEINCVIANVDWTNGVGNLKDFGIISDNAIVGGKGTIKLPTQKVKVTLYPEARNIGLTDFLVPPIAISGKFDNISVYPEAKGTAVSAIKTAAGIATGVGIFAKLGEIAGNKTGLSDSLGMTTRNPCNAIAKTDVVPSGEPATAK